MSRASQTYQRHLPPQSRTAGQSTAFAGSKNLLSITTIPTFGDEDLSAGASATRKPTRGLLAFDAVVDTEKVPMRLWVAALCGRRRWVLFPSKMRLLGTVRPIRPKLRLTEYLQPIPAALHPDSDVFTGHWQYAQFDAGRELRCRNGSAIAFTAGFDMTLALSSLKIVFGEGLQADGKTLHVPDIDLFLTPGQTYESSKRWSILEILLHLLGPM